MCKLERFPRLFKRMSAVGDFRNKQAYSNGWWKFATHTMQNASHVSYGRCRTQRLNGVRTECANRQQRCDETGAMIFHCSKSASKRSSGCQNFFEPE